MTSEVPTPAGLSIGELAIVASFILIAASITYLINSKKKEQNSSSNSGPINKILTDENRHKGDKIVIQNAIKEQDWETLEDMLDSRTSDFPDLIQMIKKALNNRQ